MPTGKLFFVKPTGATVAGKPLTMANEDQNKKSV